MHVDSATEGSVFGVALLNTLLALDIYNVDVIAGCAPVYELQEYAFYRCIL
jgi:hypothetical protein